MAGDTHPAYDQLKARLIRNGQLFEDPEFPASMSSLVSHGKVPISYRDIVWKRPGEISRNPKFFVGGKSRMDLQQGQIGDCWFIAGVACVSTMNMKLLDRVVPSYQSFDQNYAGIFHFHFWEFGKWVEVVIDDRIPTINGATIFMANRIAGETNEFWGSLLEKAYAKFKGSYHNIDGGFINDAMVDMTGGVSERFNLAKNREELRPILFDLMYRIASMNSMMGSSLPGDMSNPVPLSNGLYGGHAYSITQVASITIFGKPVRLLRVRNPWGTGEWNGAWSDGSREWNSVSDEQKRALRLAQRDDGEFWMEYNDWLEAFENLDICHLFPDGIEVSSKMEKAPCNWQVTVRQGEWVRGVSAGGCGNPPYQRLFWTNPQFAVTLGKPDSSHGDGKCAMVVSLMQKILDMDENRLPISFQVYKLRDNYPVLLDGQNYDQFALSMYQEQGTKRLFMNVREVTGHFRMDPGTYVIIPSTFKPNDESKFLLRVFTETSSATQIIDEPTRIEKPTQAPEDQYFSLFSRYAGQEKRLDAADLQKILGEIYREDVHTGFGIDVCRNILAMVDLDRSGLLDYDEFRKMLKELEQWKNKFQSYDRDRSGDIDTNELHQVFKSIGFTLSRGVLTSIVKRYGGKKRRLQFEDYLQCCTKILTMYNNFSENAKQQSGTMEVRFNLEEWLMETMLY